MRQSNLSLSFFFVQNPLGLLFKNENVNEEMIDIMMDIHSKYVPVAEANNAETDITSLRIVHRVFFGGD